MRGEASACVRGIEDISGRGHIQQAVIIKLNASSLFSAVKHLLILSRLV